jgi:hypothetical protein
MQKDRLFTLKPDFTDRGAGPFYCPGSLKIEGLLAYYPRLRDELDVIYVDFPRPRHEIVKLIGEENQGAPVLVLGEAAAAKARHPEVRSHGSVRFLNGSDNILEYIAQVYGVARPHHH